MIKVLLLSDDDTFAARLGDAIGENFARGAGGPLPPTSADLVATLKLSSAPDIVLVDAAYDEAAALGLSRSLTDAGIVALLVTDAGERIALDALRAGVRDVVPLASEAAELRDAMDRAARPVPGATHHIAPPSQGEGATRGRVICVASPKGGVGKTTVATNLAVGLAQRGPGSTVLVDLDIHFGDVASALNLNPEYTLPDVVRSHGGLDSFALKSYLTSHPTGLYVIPGSDSPAAADAVTAADVAHLLTLLSTQFDFVVVDTSPGLSEHTLAVLDHTDTLLLVTSLDVPGIRGLRKEIDTLNQVGLVTGMRYVVLNFMDPTRGLTVADVEATVRAKVDCVVPLQQSVPLSVNQGVPLLQSRGRDAATRQLALLVDLVAPPQKATRSRMFGRGRQA